jgi:hypothetical protein
VIGYTLAVLGGTRAYLYLSETVYGDNAASTGVTKANFDYSDPGNLASVTRINENANGGCRELMLQFTNPLTADELLPWGALQRTVAAAANAVFQAPYPATPGTDPYPLLPMGPDPASFPNANWPAAEGNLPYPDNAMRDAGAVPPATHNITDVGLGFIEPTIAWDPVPVQDPFPGSIGSITRFDGTKFLQDRDARLQASVLDATLQALLPTPTIDLHYDLDVAAPTLLGTLWLPVVDTLFVPAASHTGTYPGVPDSDTAHNADTAAGSLHDINDPAPPPDPTRREYLIPSTTDPKIRDGADLEFMFVATYGGISFPLARIPNPNDPRTARPWVYKIRDLRAQRGGATVSNNVINPLRGETAYVTYTLPQAGRVSVTVFTLNGDVVDVLYRGERAAGEYSTTWNGRNRGGRVVARGVYFIRIVGPGIDEIRKVLVVK